MVTWASVRGDVPRKIRGFEVPEVRGSVEGGEVTARCEVGAGAGQTGEGAGGHKGPGQCPGESRGEKEAQTRASWKPRLWTASEGPKGQQCGVVCGP